MTDTTRLKNKVYETPFTSVIVLFLSDFSAMLSNRAMSPLTFRYF